MKKIILILLLCLPVCVYADIYEQQDQGTTTYTDQPTSKNATPVTKLNDNVVQTLIPPEPQAVAPATQEVVLTTAPVNNSYTNFSMITPANEESIQNQPSLNITFAVDPALREGDVIQVYLDGNPLGNATHTTQLSFTIPDRGTHSVSAKLLNHQGIVLMSTPAHVIYVHKAHLGNS